MNMADIEAAVCEGLWASGFRQTAEPHYHRLVATAASYADGVIGRPKAIRRSRRYMAAMQRAVRRGLATGDLVLQER